MESKTGRVGAAVLLACALIASDAVVAMHAAPAEAGFLKKVKRKLGFGKTLGVTTDTVARSQAAQQQSAQRRATEVAHGYQAGGAAAEVEMTGAVATAPATPGTGVHGAHGHQYESTSAALDSFYGETSFSAANLDGAAASSTAVKAETTAVSAEANHAMVVDEMRNVLGGRR